MRRRRQNGTGGERTFDGFRHGLVQFRDSIGTATAATTCQPVGDHRQQHDTSYNSHNNFEQFRCNQRGNPQNEASSISTEKEAKRRSQQQIGFVCKCGRNECYGGYYSLICFLGQQQQSNHFSGYGLLGCYSSDTRRCCRKCKSQHVRIGTDDTDRNDRQCLYSFDSQSDCQEKKPKRIEIRRNCGLRRIYRIRYGSNPHGFTAVDGSGAPTGTWMRFVNGHFSFWCRRSHSFRL